jgi:hypothetical protein
MKNTFFLFLLAVLIAACSHTKPKDAEKPKLKDSIVVADTSFLADKNFVYLNLKNTEDVKMTKRHLESDTAGYDIYTDSTFKRKYLRLTGSQMVSLLQQFFSNDMNKNGSVVDPEYLKKYMQGWFVAKQAKVNGLQPIVLSLSGDDYGALAMVLLDKNNKPVSSFKLTEGFQPGPTEKGDSLLILPTKRESVLKDNMIITKEVTQTDFADSLKRPSPVDSNLFQTVIDKFGKFKTKQILKAKYTVPYVPNN